MTDEQCVALLATLLLIKGTGGVSPQKDAINQACDLLIAAREEWVGRSAI